MLLVVFEAGRAGFVGAHDPMCESGAISNRAAARYHCTFGRPECRGSRASCTVRTRRERASSASPNRAFGSPVFGR